MSYSFRLLLSCALLILPCHAQQAEENNAPNVPADLLDDPHVREELAINEFTAPSISLIFDSLNALAPLPIAGHEREVPEQTPLNRADLAVEIGFMIAEGFLVVQANELGKIEKLATELTRYGKALGAGDRVRRHAASILENAKEGKSEALKEELRATQKDIELELFALRDADLAHLISLGGWIRAFVISSAAVEKQFSTERAAYILRDDIIDYYDYVIGSLAPRIAERPSYLKIRELLETMHREMKDISPESVTVEQISHIHSQAKELSKLALERREGH